MVEWKSIEDMGSFFGGLTGKTKEDFQNGNAKFITYMNVFANSSLDINTTGVVRINQGEKQNKIQKGDILFSGSSETPNEAGMSCVVTDDLEEDYYMNSFCFGLRLNNPEQYNLHYLKHIFRSYNIRQAISKTASGVTRFNISKARFGKVQIPIPSLSEQKRIVGILDTFTDSIENLKQQIAQRRKQYEYYRDQLLNLEGEEGVEMKTIQDVCKRICSGGTPSTSHKEYYNGNIPWLRTQEIDWKEIEDTEIKISEKAIANSSAKIIPINCVIVAMYGATAAKSAINKIPLSTNQACCNLEIDRDIALYKYVYQWFCKEYQNLKAMGEGSQNNINGRKIKEYPIPVPSLTEQSRIVSILDTFEASISNLEAQLKEREKQYEYYRNKLLTFE